MAVDRFIKIGDLKANRTRSHPCGSPIPSWDLETAKGQIMSWVRTEDIPKNEWERLKTPDPNDPEHNLHAVYAVNYALKIAGAIPGASVQRSSLVSANHRAETLHDAIPMVARQNAGDP